MGIGILGAVRIAQEAAGGTIARGWTLVGEKVVLEFEVSAIRTPEAA